MSDISTAGLRTENPLSPQAPAKVLIFDRNESRLTFVKKITANCGIKHLTCGNLASAIELAESNDCCFALIGLGSCPAADDPCLRAISQFKHRGLKIICYEAGVMKWPVGALCHALLAGAARVLDSARINFAEELRSLLAQLLRTHEERAHEELQLKLKMRQLGIIGESQEMLAVFRLMQRVSALSDLPVLITGETGTGKELIANALYRLDPKRCDGPFVALNCGAISAGIAESELFGHRRGAFTGAERERKGLFRAAEGGVIFLDEIGELSEALQVKFLRVIQEGRVLSVGEEKEAEINVRIIAATNRNLEDMVARGEFRADLLHRLNILSIKVPPLRERPADYQPLINHFLRKHNALRPEAKLAVDADFIAALTQLEIPGNGRQLENLVRRALINKDDHTPLNLSDLPPELWQQLSQQNQRDAVAPPIDETQVNEAGSEMSNDTSAHSDLAGVLHLHQWNLARSLEYCERLLLESALQFSQGNQSETARLLGITPRSVYNKVRKYHLQN